MGRGQRPLATEGGLYLDICTGIPPSSYKVTPLLMGPVCLLNQSRFQEQVRSWKLLLLPVRNRAAVAAAVNLYLGQRRILRPRQH